MSDEYQIIQDSRGFIFTIDGETEPVYQVDSKYWASEEHRWHHNDIPTGLLAGIEQIRSAGKPGAFARFSQGGGGVYVICEENIKRLPEPAEDDIVFDPSPPEGSDKRLAHGDIVVCPKGGLIKTDSGDLIVTEPNMYYVMRSEDWSKYTPDPSKAPHYVRTTSDVLRLLSDLNEKEFLSMNPDKPGDGGQAAVRQDPMDPGYHIACYVLSLARFERQSLQAG